MEACFANNTSMGSYCPPLPRAVMPTHVMCRSCKCSAWSRCVPTAWRIIKTAQPAIPCKTTSLCTWTKLESADRLALHGRAGAACCGPLLLVLNSMKHMYTHFLSMVHLPPHSCALLLASRWLSLSFFSIGLSLQIDGAGRNQTGAEESRSPRHAAAGWRH